MPERLSASRMGRGPTGMMPALFAARSIAPAVREDTEKLNSMQGSKSTCLLPAELRPVAGLSVTLTGQWACGWGWEDLGHNGSGQSCLAQG